MKEADLTRVSVFGDCAAVLVPLIYSIVKRANSEAFLDRGACLLNLAVFEMVLYVYFFRRATTLKVIPRSLWMCLLRIGPRAVYDDFVVGLLAVVSQLQRC